MSLLRQIAFGLGLLAALAAWYLYSQHQLTTAREAAQTATNHARDLAAELDAARKDVRIVTRYVDRVHTIHERGRTIVQKVPVYVPQTADAACTVNRGFVRVHNAAAEGTDLPARASSADAAPAGVALSAVAGTVSDNYTTYHALAARLTALQEWVRAHSAPAPAASATGPP
jgi:hypothetical protein